MTVMDVFEQARTLNARDRKTLAKLLIDSLELEEEEEQEESTVKTGREIVEWLMSIPPIELVDPHLEDPVEWLEAQRAKRDRHIWDDNE